MIWHYIRIGMAKTIDNRRRPWYYKDIKNKAGDRQRSKKMRNITKKEAREIIKNGGSVLAFPSKINPHNIWISGLTIDNATTEYKIKEYIYYNCTSETGKALRFYVD